MLRWNLSQYIRSPSTLLGFATGIVMYGTYALAHAAWVNGILIATCAIVAVCLPSYSRLSNKIEERINLRFAIVTFGRASRFAVQLIFNFAVFAAFFLGGSFSVRILGPSAG